MKKVIVRLENFSKSFGKKEVIKNINLDVYENEFLTLLGSSGCGKTTMLRSISGLDNPTSGRVYIDGVDVTNLEAPKRQVNTIFQNYALFPLMAIGISDIGYGVTDAKIGIVLLTIFSIISYMIINIKSEAVLLISKKIKKVDDINKDNNIKIINFINKIILLDKFVFLGELVMIIRFVAILLSYK